MIWAHSILKQGNDSITEVWLWRHVDCSLHADCNRPRKTSIWGWSGPLREKYCVGGFGRPFPDFTWLVHLRGSGGKDAFLFHSCAASSSHFIVSNGNLLEDLDSLRCLVYGLGVTESHLWIVTFCEDSHQAFNNWCNWWLGIGHSGLDIYNWSTQLIHWLTEPGITAESLPGTARNEGQ